MFVPKEIAPYLGMIAPMVAPQLGILGSMALSQAGSIKMHGGKLDPYSAAATAISLGSPQARAIRAAGRVDPSQGTIGQKMSSYIGKSLDSMSTDPKSFSSTLARGFDPTRAMDKATAGGFDSYYENPFMAEFDSQGQYKTFLDDSGNERSFSKVRKTKDNIIQDTFDEKYGMTRADRGVAGLTAEEKIKHRHHHHHCRRRRRLNRRRSVSPSRPRNRNDEYDPSCKLKCTFTTTKNYLLLVFYSLFLVSLVGTTPLTRKISALHISTTV